MSHPVLLTPVNALAAGLFTRGKARLAALFGAAGPRSDSPPEGAASALTSFPWRAACFAEQGGALLVGWNEVLMAATLAQLQDLLRADGCVPGREWSRSRVAHGSDHPGRCVGIEVQDPVLGNFTLQLWLLLDWDRGAYLTLGAFAPVAPAQAMRTPPDGVRGALAHVQLAHTRMHWPSFSQDAAQAALLAWQRSVLAPGAEGDLERHWPSLAAALDAARAP